MGSGANSVLLEVITPREMFYSGQVEMLSVPTVDGQEGFMAGHVWCVKLLAPKGKIAIREAGASELKFIATENGYVDIREHFVVYTDAAEWTEKK